MDDPTGEIRAGAPRVPRVRRSKKEEQEHIRDVLAALGGSPDEWERTHDSAVDPSATLGSRVAAYTRLVSATATPATAAAAAPAPAAPVVTKSRPERVRRPVRRRQRRRPVAALVRAALSGVLFLARLAPRAGHAVALAVRRVAAAVTTAAQRSRPHAVRIIQALATVAVRATRTVVAALRRAAATSAHSVVASGRRSGRVVGAAAVTLPRAAAALKPAPRPRRRPADVDGESESVAETVMAWVQPRPERVVGEATTSVVAPPPEPSPTPVLPAQRESAVAVRDTGRRIRGLAAKQPRRTRAILGALAVGAIVAAVLVTLQLSRGSTGATRSAAAAAPPPQPVPTRSDYSDARDYGAAMTRLALTSSRTDVDGDITCDESSTWAHWTCQARGKPSVGAYAGVWLTYRCSPAATAQPGGNPDSVMINCTPQKQPATS